MEHQVASCVNALVQWSKNKASDGPVFVPLGLVPSSLSSNEVVMLFNQTSTNKRLCFDNEGYIVCTSKNS